jgi:ribosomal protein L37AE/L43A
MTSDAMRCHRHPAQPTGLRCDECGRPFCRECLVNRFLTSRSSIWLCRGCASGWSGGSFGGSGSPGGSVRALVARYWWALAAVALVALLSAGQPGRLFGA